MSLLHNEHRFTTSLRWTGNRGTGTSSHRAYGREYETSAPLKSAPIPGSSSPVYRGDKERYNPEELLIASLSACHMLWFLHLCADAGIAVTDYRDHAEGGVHINGDGSGEVREVVLHPHAEFERKPSDEEIERLHHRAHELCFIARSVNFPVRCEPAS